MSNAGNCWLGWTVARLSWSWRKRELIFIEQLKNVLGTLHCTNQGRLRLLDMKLIDYKVRVVNCEAGTAARIRVIVESTDGEDIWGTVGVSENIIEASWLALVDAVEYKLYKDEEA